MPEFVYKRISPINLFIYAFTSLCEQHEIYNKLTSDKGRLRFDISGHDEFTVVKKSLDRENSIRGSILGGKCNRCVIFPTIVSLVAKALEIRNQDW